MFRSWWAQLSDRRSARTIPVKLVFEARLFGAALQDLSVHKLEPDCRDGALRTRIGSISVDIFRYVLQRIDRQSFLRMWGRDRASRKV